MVLKYVTMLRQRCVSIVLLYHHQYSKDMSVSLSMNSCLHTSTDTGHFLIFSSKMNIQSEHLELVRVARQHCSNSYPVSHHPRVWLRQSREGLLITCIQQSKGGTKYRQTESRISLGALKRDEWLHVQCIF